MPNINYELLYFHKASQDIQYFHQTVRLSCFHTVMKERNTENGGIQAYESIGLNTNVRGAYLTDFVMDFST